MRSGLVFWRPTAWPIAAGVWLAVSLEPDLHDGAADGLPASAQAEGID
jgi:hypothetical protein